MLNTHFEIHYDLHSFIAQIGKEKMDLVRQRILTSADNFFGDIWTAAKPNAEITCPKQTRISGEAPLYT